MKRNIIFLVFTILFLSTKPVWGQFSSATIGINGLTCSMCSYSVESAIRPLLFVKSIEMDLNKNVATIFFKEGSKPDFNKLVKKVFEAGFSVRFVVANLNVEKAIQNESLLVQDKTYKIINFSQEIPVGEVKLKLLGKGFLPKSGLKEAIVSLPSSLTKEAKSGKIILAKIVYP